MSTSSLAATVSDRRRHIESNAPCVGCGATLASCVAERGKDPTAPPWFGCCARGADMRPCRHVPSVNALLELLGEVESGRVRTVEEVTGQGKVRPRPYDWFAYLNQAETWRPKTGPEVRIASMDARWRFNAARFLRRRAAAIATSYDFAELAHWTAFQSSPLGLSEDNAADVENDMEGAQDARLRDPVAWIRTTKLHRALMADLAADYYPQTKAEKRGPRPGCRPNECAISMGQPELGCACLGVPPEWTI